MRNNRLPWLEISLVHGVFVLIILFACFAPLELLDWYSLVAYLIGSGVAYWLILLFLRRPKILERKWRESQGSQKQGRHITSLAIMTADLFHILNMLFGLLVVSALLLFNVEHGQGINRFFQAFCLSVSAVGANATCGVELKTDAGQWLVLADYFIGLILLAYLVAICTRSLETVRPIFGDVQKD